MKVLWITNRPIGKFEKQFNVNATSGTWMEPTLDALSKMPGLEISIATVGNCKKIIMLDDGNVQYYCLPRGRAPIYEYKNKTNIAMWSRLIHEISPDLIQVWGTEYAHGLCALSSSHAIPSVIYMQGIIDSVARYFFAGLSLEEMKKAVSFRDIVKMDTLKMQYKKYVKRSIDEKQMIRLSGNVIIENKWAAMHCKAIAENCNVHQCGLDISKIFFEKNWQLDQCDKHTIMCAAPGYPLKGLHILIKSLAIVKKSIPDIILKVPGMSTPFNNSIKFKLKESGYTKYLVDLIHKLNLTENIIFLGRLSPSQMAQNMEKAHVFVIPSSIENHSSTLREAMIVGTPSISSYVGGIPEIIENGENAFLYRFEEYEQLAENIITIIKNESIARCLSENGKKSMSLNHDSAQTTRKLFAIYEDIIRESNRNG